MILFLAPPPKGISGGYRYNEEILAHLPPDAPRVEYRFCEADVLEKAIAGLSSSVASSQGGGAGASELAEALSNAHAVLLDSLTFTALSRKALSRLSRICPTGLMYHHMPRLDPDIGSRLRAKRQTDEAQRLASCSLVITPSAAVARSVRRLCARHAVRRGRRSAGIRVVPVHPGEHCDGFGAAGTGGPAAGYDATLHRASVAAGFAYAAGSDPPATGSTDTAVRRSPAHKSTAAAGSTFPTPGAAHHAYADVPAADSAHDGGVDSPVRILSVGSVEPRKAQAELFRALERLPHLNWRWDVVGSPESAPEYAQSLTGAVVRSPLSSRVTIHGGLGRDETRRLFREADIFALPSRFETYGMVFAEARCAGLPVLARAVGGVPEVVRHRAEGLLVAPGRPIAGALALLIADRSRRAELALGARASAAALPGWDEQAAMFADALRVLARGAQGAGRKRRVRGGRLVRGGPWLRGRATHARGDLPYGRAARL